MVRVKVNRAYISSFLLFASTSILLRILDFGNWGSRVKKTGWMRKTVWWRSSGNAEEYGTWLSYKSDITTSDITDIDL